MSFLLDALRKSDARRRQQGPPGLHSAETTLPRRRRRGGGLKLVLVSMMGAVVLAGALASVAVFRPHWLPDRVAAVIAPADIPDSEAPTTATGQPSEADQIARRLSEMERATALDAASEDEALAGLDAAQSDHTVADQTAGEAEPEVVVDRRQPLGSRAARTVTRQAPQRETPPVPADEAMAELERRVAESAADRSAPPPRRTARPEPANESASAGESAQSGTATEPQQPLHSDVAEYVRVWELPLSVRRNLPDLDLTIHVFSPRENERFVLVNGERYIAGDVLGQGVQLVDIRREGAIVDFRSHRFLLEPR